MNKDLENRNIFLIFILSNIKYYNMVQDFYNKVATEIRATYFPNENHGTTTNKNYFKVSKSLEDFNNGCLTYKMLIDKLSKSCNVTTTEMRELLEKYFE